MDQDVLATLDFSGELPTDIFDVFSSAPDQVVPPKVGTRFSRESLKILRNWLAAHTRHPFPTEEERQMLQQQTGLSKTQILNWLANARRRGKVAGYKTASPRGASPAGTGPRDIPRRRSDTPAPSQRTPFVNPLERWVDSPPEDEPAAASAIARAVASTDPYTSTDAWSGSSHRPSPASSTRTSRSSSSAYSHESGDSGSWQRRRRKRRGGRQSKTPLLAPLNTFQCTFCTETFSTKHAWHRHERTLHLALERWVCAPYGALAMVDGVASCVFCGEATPSDDHMEQHNYSICQNRSVEDRTFHRKDHLGQHLRLMHNLKPEQLGLQLREWKQEPPAVRSRCGFCGLQLTSFSARADHLAEHFKSGSSMSDWKGDWGLDPPILDRLENAMSPYLIEYERNSPYPYSACRVPLESPTNAYELIKLELVNFVEGYYDRTGRIPSSEEIQCDACRIVFAAEIPSYRGDECHSWLRDLILSSGPVVQKAKLSPFRSARESRLSFLWIIGKKSPFDSCPLEAQLLEFAQSGDEVTDVTLQQEAIRIIQQLEAATPSPADIPVTWLLELARSSTSWLRAFQARAGLVTMASTQMTNTTVIDQILQNYKDLEEKLAESVELVRQHGIEPDDVTLRQQALRIIQEFPDPDWRTLAASNHAWLARFKRRHLPWADRYNGEALGTVRPTDTVFTGQQPETITNATQGTMGGYILNDPNFDKWAARELSRWVSATMSPNNPNQHVPTDEELQHQARWIIFEDGDGFNTTFADNAEWLQRFKRDAGILKDEGPGLTTADV